MHGLTAECVQGFIITTLAATIVMYCFFNAGRYLSRRLNKALPDAAVSKAA